MTPSVVGSLVDKWLDSDFVCSKIGMCDSPKYIEEDFQAWMEETLKGKPDTPIPTYNSTETFNVAHISDLHIDFEYTEGSNSYCDEPLCCHASNGPGTNTTAAGKWGAYHDCDVPPHTLEAALRDLKTKEFDFMVWTGDNPPHNIWNQSQEEQKFYIGYTADLAYEIFNETNIPIYPTLGNHGCFPVNVIDFEDDSWITDWMALKWSYWLPMEQQAQIRQWGGAYSILNEQHNLRIISLNTNACNAQNWYFFRNVTDQGGQITFMAQELAKAEAAGEKVYIIGHIAPCLGSCLSAWAKHYGVLIERYEHIVAGQFFGHTHSDQTCITRSITSGKPIGTQYMPGAITTYSWKNPSFRVYQIEKDSKIVYDWQEWRLDMPYYNANPDLVPVWDLAYTFKAEYNLTDMLPETMGKWVSETLLNDEAAAVKYLYNYNTGSPAAPSSCDASCRKSMSCEMNYSVAEDQLKCSNSTQSWSDKLIEDLFGPWTYKVGS